MIGRGRSHPSIGANNCHLRPHRNHAAHRGSFPTVPDRWETSHGDTRRKSTRTGQSTNYRRVTKHRVQSRDTKSPRALAIAPPIRNVLLAPLVLALLHAAPALGIAEVLLVDADATPELRDDQGYYRVSGSSKQSWLSFWFLFW